MNKDDQLENLVMFIHKRCEASGLNLEHITAALLSVLIRYCVTCDVPEDALHTCVNLIYKECQENFSHEKNTSACKQVTK